MSAKEKTFEENLSQLEGLMSEMESGKLSLGKSIDSFEQSVDLFKKCKAYLNNAQKRVEELSKDLRES